MTKIFKTFLFLMSLAGLYVLYLGVVPVLGTIQFLMQKPQKVKGTFEGYEVVSSVQVDRSLNSGNRNVQPDYYPKFSYIDANGNKHNIKSLYKHLYRIYEKGHEIEVLIPNEKHNESQPRIAGLLSLFSMDGLYVIVGLFMVVAGLFFFYFFPWGDSVTAGSAGLNVDNFFKDFWDRVNEHVNLRWLPGLFNNLIMLAIATVIAVTLVVWKPWQIPARNAYLRAVESGDLSEVKTYIDEGYEADIVNDYDQTALNLAVENQHWDIARFLLESGARVDIESKMHRFPLEWAVYYNNTEIALLILEKGSPVNNLLMDPLGRAYLHRNLDILEGLIKYGADVHTIYALDKNMTFTEIMEANKEEEVLKLIHKYDNH